jgi:hypothetical protein
MQSLLITTAVILFTLGALFSVFLYVVNKMLFPDYGDDEEITE